MTLARRVATGLSGVLALFIVAGLAQVGYAGVPRALARVSGRPLSVEFTKVSPAMRVGKPLVLAGTVSNPGTVNWLGARVYLEISSTPATTPSGLDQLAAVPPGDPFGHPVTDKHGFVTLGNVPTGQQRSFSLSVPYRWLAISGAAGAYRVGVEVVASNGDGSGDNVVHAGTLVPLLPSGNAAIVPAQTVTLLPITGTVKRLLGGVFADDSLGRVHLVRRPTARHPGLGAARVDRHGAGRGRPGAAGRDHGHVARLSSPVASVDRRQRAWSGAHSGRELAQRLRAPHGAAACAVDAVGQPRRQHPAPRSSARSRRGLHQGEPWFPADPSLRRRGCRMAGRRQVWDPGRHRPAPRGRGPADRFGGQPARHRCQRERVRRYRRRSWRSRFRHRHIPMLVTEATLAGIQTDPRTTALQFRQRLIADAAVRSLSGDTGQITVTALPFTWDPGPAVPGSEFASAFNLPVIVAQSAFGALDRPGHLVPWVRFAPGPPGCNRSAPRSCPLSTRTGSPAGTWRRSSTLP